MSDPRDYGDEDDYRTEDEKREEAEIEAERLKAITLARIDEGLRIIMGDFSGRAFMWSALTFCHVGATSFSSDALVMANKEGERNVGLMLQAEIYRVCPEKFLLMAQENS